MNISNDEEQFDLEYDKSKISVILTKKLNIKTKMFLFEEFFNQDNKFYHLHFLDLKLYTNKPNFKREIFVKKNSIFKSTLHKIRKLVAIYILNDWFIKAFKNDLNEYKSIDCVSFGNYIRMPIFDDINYNMEHNTLVTNKIYFSSKHTNEYINIDNAYVPNWIYTPTFILVRLIDKNNKISVIYNTSWKSNIMKLLRAYKENEVNLRPLISACNIESPSDMIVELEYYYNMNLHHIVTYKNGEIKFGKD